MLTVKVEEQGASRVVRLSGECDIASAPQLQEALKSMRGPDITEVIVDATELDFMDSTGLGVVMGALKRLKESGGTLKIAGARGPVRRVLEVTGLDRVIPLFEDIEGATA